MDSFKIRELIRDNIATLVPYSSARSEYNVEGSLLLDANENYREIVGNQELNRYPDPLHTALKDKIEKVLGLPKENLAIGNGSDELIDLLFRIFCNPKKDKALLISPTYGAYEVFANINDVGVSHCQLKGDFTIDLKKMETVCKLVNNGTPHSGMHKLLFICSPNNPSGNTFPIEQIEMMAGRFKGIVVVDEAYIEYAPTQSVVKLIEKYPRLVILRTFSKAWALANVRVGIAVTSKEIVSIIERVKPPYNLSGVAQKLAIEALDHADDVKKEIKKTIQERQRVAAYLESHPFVEKVFPSEANFLLVRVNDPNHLCDFLKERNIIIRNRSNIRGCYQSVRISIGSVEQNEQLISAMEELKELI